MDKISYSHDKKCHKDQYVAWKLGIQLQIMYVFQFKTKMPHFMDLKQLWATLNCLDLLYIEVMIYHRDY